MAHISKIQKRAFITIVILIIVVAVSACGKTGTNNSTENKKAIGNDIVIKKSEITDLATFIPYQAGNVKMEVIAVKAPDGTVRTAFNTCQVCFDSGRGYYVQEGDELVCQNCGNRFNISKIEKQKNGCNPVPILEEDKKRRWHGNYHLGRISGPEQRLVR
jgi:uncharacterized membrane protein